MMTAFATAPLSLSVIPSDASCYFSCSSLYHSLRRPATAFGRHMLKMTLYTNRYMSVRALATACGQTPKAVATLLYWSRGLSFARAVSVFVNMGRTQITRPNAPMEPVSCVPPPPCTTTL